MFRTLHEITLELSAIELVVLIGCSFVGIELAKVLAYVLMGRDPDEGDQ